MLSLVLSGGWLGDYCAPKRHMSLADATHEYLTCREQDRLKKLTITALDSSEHFSSIASSKNGYRAPSSKIFPTSAMLVIGGAPPPPSQQRNVPRSWSGRKQPTRVRSYLSSPFVFLRVFDPWRLNSFTQFSRCTIPLSLATIMRELTRKKEHEPVTCFRPKHAY